MMKQTCSKLICPECAKAIHALGWPCVRILNLVCTYYRHSQILNYDENYGQDSYRLKSAVRYLELKRYIVTTEMAWGADQAGISAKPDFSRCTWNEENQFFCWHGQSYQTSGS